MTPASTVNGSAACEGLDRKCSWRGVHVASVAASGLSGSCLKPAPSGRQVNQLCPWRDGLVGSAPLSSASAPAPALAPAPVWWPNPSWRPRCLQHPHSRLSLAAPCHKNGQSWGALHTLPFPGTCTPGDGAQLSALGPGLQWMVTWGPQRGLGDVCMLTPGNLAASCAVAPAAGAHRGTHE